MPTKAAKDSIARARRWANIYRNAGYQPLPSDPSEKKPLCRFRDYWTAPAPDDLFDQFPSPNIQVICGCYWGLAVIDLDGEEALEEWETWPPLEKGKKPWISSCSADSRHLWFSIHKGRDKLSSGRLWGIPEGDGWKRHVAIERLADKKLVMAPPSRHPKKGKLYRFEHGYSPTDIKVPMLMPPWLLNKPFMKHPKDKSDEQGIGENLVVAPLRMVVGSCNDSLVQRLGITTSDVLAAISDKASIACSWGLRFAGNRADREGWVSVHAVGREDRNPSASFHVDSGHYIEFRDGESLSFFDLGARLGAYATWQDCRADMARQCGLIPN